MHQIPMSTQDGYALPATDPICAKCNRTVHPAQDVWGHYEGTVQHLICAILSH